MKRPFHPLLLAVYPAISLYSLNQGLIPVNQVALPVALCVATTAVVWLLAALLLRSAQRSALVASAAVTAFFLYGHLRDAFHVSDNLAVWIWLPLYVVLLLASGWNWKSQTQLTAAANAVSILLVCFPAFSIAFGGTPGSAVVKKSFAPALKHEKPDIIHIVLDGYGRADALQRVMGFDNRSFVEALEARGFQVLPEARTNYVQTEQSLASTLNLNYLQELFKEVPQQSMARGPLDEAVGDSFVRQRLHALGYSSIAISTGFPFFTFKSADLVLGEHSGNALFLTSLLNLTPLQAEDSVVQSQYAVKRKTIMSAFESLSEFAAPSRTPKYVFAHILMPHPPFVFGPNGEPTELRVGAYSLSDGSHFMAHGGTPELYRKGYVDQITYLNKLVLNTLDRIRSVAKAHTIIVIQGDHGSKLGLDQDSLAKTDVSEVAPILLAVKGPAMPPDLTPVNLYRIIFSQVFGDHYPQLTNRTYYSTWERPFVYADVSAQVP